MSIDELYDKVISTLEQNDERIIEIKDAFQKFIESENENTKYILDKLDSKISRLTGNITEAIEDIQSDILLENIR